MPPKKNQGASGTEFTKFVEGKMRTWFKMNDLKHDGMVGKSDYKDNCDVFIKEFKLGEQKANELKNWLMNGWDILVKKGLELSDKGEDGGLTREKCPLLFDVNDKLNRGDRINEDEYVNAFGELVDVNKDLFEEVFSKFVGSFFDTFDTDHDGLLCPEDMIRGLRCFGITHEDAIRQIFDAMDKSRMGRIDKATYVGNWVEFMCGHDKEAPMAKFFCHS